VGEVVEAAVAVVVCIDEVVREDLVCAELAAVGEIVEDFTTAVVGIGAHKT